MHIRVDDLQGPEVALLLQEHLREMHAISPPESTHALGLEELRHPSITFWTAWDDSALLGCVALKELDPRHGEIKSMRTSPAHRQKGVGTALLRHLIAEAEARAYERLSLETGSMAEFAPARALYARFGFTYCAPFADYRPDPNSVFMTRRVSSPTPNIS